MRIAVINASPKGENSITYQTMRLIMQVFPEHSYDVLHAGKLIRSYEKDFAQPRAALASADLIVFVYPVYTFIAPSQLHRFIELMKASGIDLRDKYATQITTSKHFYDVTAHRYIVENSQDMGMRFIRGLSADMDDLLNRAGRKDAVKFFRHVLWCMESGIYEPVPLSQPAPARIPVTITVETEKHGGDIVILTDAAADDAHLTGMIGRFRAVCSRNTRVLNIREYPFKGGCISCFNCAATGKCIYRDGFDDFLRNEIQTADAIVYAFRISDHSMGVYFKRYDDRQFCNGHRTVTMGMPMGYIISGNYKYEENLRMIIEGRCEVGHNFFCGAATDEENPDAAIDRLAQMIGYALDNRYVQPQNFLGIGGMKIFRDLIYLMQGMMRADHKFYKAHKQYDFPQKKPGTILKMYLVGMLMNNPKLRSNAAGKISEGMIAPYEKALTAAAGEDYTAH